VVRKDNSSSTAKTVGMGINEATGKPYPTKKGKGKKIKKRGNKK